jgi:hypothetical protein
MKDFKAIKGDLDGKLIIAGVGGEETSDSGAPVDVNRVMIGMKRTGKTPMNFSWSQAKHHRWRLDKGQVERYGVGGALGEKQWWWESIDIHERQCRFVCVNSWLTFCVLICEDLARQDPVADLVRTVGPNLVIGLLLDGPQHRDRWSARYATVLADDPRSSVLTVTCAGLADLMIAQGTPGPRNVALWKDALSGIVKEIPLHDGAKGIILSLCPFMAKEWSADGRSDNGRTGYLQLTGIHQLYG